MHIHRSMVPYCCCVLYFCYFILTVLETICYKNALYAIGIVISIYRRQDHFSLILYIKFPLGFNFEQHKIPELKHCEKLQLMPQLGLVYQTKSANPSELLNLRKLFRNVDQFCIFERT